MRRLVPCLLLASWLMGGSPVGAQQGRPVGAPQLLEIPAQTSLSSEQSELSNPSPSTDENGRGQGKDTSQQPARITDQIELGHTPAPSPLPYLGVLFATAEAGAEGVRVLRVIEGSPAARAGFEGKDGSRSRESDLKEGLMKGALILLSMTPANPLVFPILIARKEYEKRHPPGDVIVSVQNEVVRNAQEFNTVLRRFQPGQTVQVSVLRRGQQVQIPVELEAEPVDEIE